jgi:hypothetical protein
MYWCLCCCRQLVVGSLCRAPSKEGSSSTARTLAAIWHQSIMCPNAPIDAAQALIHIYGISTTCVFQIDIRYPKHGTIKHLQVKDSKCMQMAVLFLLELWFNKSLQCAVLRAQSQHMSFRAECTKSSGVYTYLLASSIRPSLRFFSLSQFVCTLQAKKSE